MTVFWQEAVERSRATLKYKCKYDIFMWNKYHPKLLAVSLSFCSLIHFGFLPCPLVFLSIAIWWVRLVLKISKWTMFTSINEKLELFIQLTAIVQGLHLFVLQLLPQKCPEPSTCFPECKSWLKLVLSIINILLNIPMKVQQPRKHVNIPKMLISLDYLVMELCRWPDNKVAQFSLANVQLSLNLVVVVVVFFKF